MRVIFVFIILFISVISSTFGQFPFSIKIDSLIEATTQKPFNGVIVVSQNGQIIYSKTFGVSDLDKKTALQLDDQFYIGSISKQITAVLLLREMEKGHLHLSDPIHKYLPQLTEKWSDSVTIHQLLTHTHGIIALDKPLEFRPGSRFSYSKIGYKLLEDIVEKTARKSFMYLANELFNACKMQHTFYPNSNKPAHVVNGYSEEHDGILNQVQEPLKDIPVAAGGFISNVKDLILWNEYLHNGKLLADTTYKMMMTKQKNAVRQHPIFGPTEYGYGITVSDQDGIVQLGQTGYVEGFPSMNFYYPATKISIIILSNISWNSNDIKKIFYYHIQTLNFLHLLLKD